MLFAMIETQALRSFHHFHFIGYPFSPIPVS